MIQASGWSASWEDEDGDTENVYYPSSRPPFNTDDEGETTEGLDHPEEWPLEEETED